MFRTDSDSFASSSVLMSPVMAMSRMVSCFCAAVLTDMAAGAATAAPDTVSLPMPA